MIVLRRPWPTQDQDRLEPRLGGPHGEVRRALVLVPLPLQPLRFRRRCQYPTSPKIPGVRLRRLLRSDPPLARLLQQTTGQQGRNMHPHLFPHQDLRLLRSLSNPIQALGPKAHPLFPLPLPHQRSLQGCLLFPQVLPPPPVFRILVAGDLQVPHLIKCQVKSRPFLTTSKRAANPLSLPSGRAPSQTLIVHCSTWQNWMASLAVSVSTLTRILLRRKWWTIHRSSPRLLRHSMARLWTHFLRYGHRPTLQDLVFQIHNVLSMIHMVHPRLLRPLPRFLILVHLTRLQRAVSPILQQLRDGQHLATIHGRCRGLASRGLLGKTAT